MRFFQKLYEGGYSQINAETPKTAEYQEQSNIVSETERKLRKTLSPELLEVFDRYVTAQTECESMNHIQVFEQGFRAGVEFYQDFSRTDHLLEKE